MKCHYEVLGVTPNCTSDDLKKAYRKLALEWHPDKNLDRLTEATEIFQLIQQAYEILIDPQERAWYDRHKDDILRGDAEGAYKDDCLNVYQYFNGSCFKGYTDDEKGFYTVYREVFEKIAAEDKPFMEDDEEFEIPVFGFSYSSYEDVVHNFYAYWQSYCTAKSYSWVDQYFLSDARKSGAGRQVIRMMEKENKKLRDQHKKSRNEEIRELVAFVRKRDKRVQAHKKASEEKKVEKAKKAEELRRQQIVERNKEFENYKESEWSSMSQVEARFNELENTLDNTFGAEAESVDEDEETGELYCPACEKDFRSEKAYKNHENSKKHKDNVILLKYLMEEEDEEALQHNGEAETVLEVQHSSESDEGESSTALLGELIKGSTKSKKKKKKSKKPSSQASPMDGVNKDTEEISSLLNEIKIDEASMENAGPEGNLESTEAKATIVSSSKKKKVKKPRSDEEVSLNSAHKKDDIEEEKPTTTCERCNVNFKTRNKLFDHLKESGHAVYKNENSKQNSSSRTSKKQRKKNS